MVTGAAHTSIQSIAVFSSSTTIASMFLPRTVETASSYLRWVGLQRSTTRPRTPGKIRWRLESVSLRRVSRWDSCWSTPACVSFS